MILGGTTILLFKRLAVILCYLQHQSPPGDTLHYPEISLFSLNDSLHFDKERFARHILSATGSDD